MAAGINKLERQLVPTTVIVIAKTEILWQVTSYKHIFENGSLLLIHGKIRIPRANGGTKRPRCGSFRATLSQNGRRLERNPFCGCMGKVS